MFLFRSAPFRRRVQCILVTFIAYIVRNSWRRGRKRLMNGAEITPHMYCTSQNCGTGQWDQVSVYVNHNQLVVFSFIRSCNNQEDDLPHTTRNHQEAQRKLLSWLLARERQTINCTHKEAIPVDSLIDEKITSITRGMFWIIVLHKSMGVGEGRCDKWN